MMLVSIVFVCIINTVLSESQPQLQPDPEVWIERGAPDCTTTEDDCGVFGLEYVRSGVGEGSACDTGTAVLCRSSAPHTSLVDTPAHTLAALSYNAFERNWFMSHDGQRERSCRVPATLRRMLPDLDVIGFQEVFMGGCFRGKLTLRHLLAQHGFPYTTRTVGAIIPQAVTDDDNDMRVGFKVLNGGMFVASRWPIVQEDSIIYENADPLSWDGFSKKGVSYAKINKTDASGRWKLYNLFSTHQQTGDNADIKVGQAAEQRAFVDRLAIPPDQPVLFLGDYNIDLYDDDELLSAVMATLEATLPATVGERECTSDGENDLHDDEKSCSWLDYVAFSHTHEKPTHATMEAVRPMQEEGFPICFDEGKILRFGYLWPDDERCTNKNYAVRDLSDHFAVLGRYMFPE
ncbi:PREDICTED: sphingomyelinase C-like [Priapulus caudatus]|uniref:sphingomyelin phosphodiesterase n=1 Tax=Priapulus caudatus TaxID=37621 RepID=A0ABM1DXG8_PRICU|nr:PREDICTED: sphingomyelinase C-like [Priapulus caudatus]